MEFEQISYPQPHPQLRALGEPPDRRVPWGSIAGLLIILIILVGGALWFLGRDDDGGDADAVTAASSTTTTTTTTTIGPSTTPPPTTSEVPASAADLGPPTLSDASTVSTVGLDTVQFGMTVARAQNAAGAFMIPTGPTSDCYTVLPDGGPHGVTFTVINSTIERVDIDAGAVTTRSGIGIGTPEDVVTERFGPQLERSVNDDGTVDLIFVPADENDADFRVIFTVSNGNVFRFRSGKMPGILDDAPCTGTGQDQAGSSSS